MAASPEELPAPSISVSMICRLVAPASFRTSQYPFARIRLLRIVTLFAPAAMTRGVVISLESITVPDSVICDGPVYGVSVTPAGTPVLAALGKLPLVAVGAVAVGTGVAVAGAAVLTGCTQPLACTYSSLATMPPTMASVRAPCWTASTHDRRPAGSLLLLSRCW